MGEPAILRNAGRSKSQISVFDYPEHLNPFYEDENHKRLRFWKIGKKDGSNNTSRRGSFSLGGIRDMWTFKSFRGKKKSSSLGINKTSESPEPLRRSIGPNDTLYATYDPRIRNTYDNGTLNNNFQRNVPYRASLQDMAYNKTIDRNGNGFQRNDNYRSTIQIAGRRDDTFSGHTTTPRVPPRRYVYGGSITPQPRSRFDHNDSCSQGISRGSSQLSVTSSSTNPFEDYDDDDDDDIIMGHIEMGDSGRPTPTKRRLRKKRRAPPPPVPIPKIIDEESSSIPTSPVTTPSKTTITSQQSQSQSIQNESESESDYRHENQLAHQNQFKNEFTQEEKLEISEIAAEIEHFVQLLSRDEDDDLSIRLIPISPAKQPATKIQIQPATPEIKVSKQSPIFKGQIIPAYVTESNESRDQITPSTNGSESTDEVESIEEKKELVVKAEVSPVKYHAEEEVLEDPPHIQVYRRTSIGNIEDIKASSGEDSIGDIQVQEKPRPASRQSIRVVNTLMIPDDESNALDVKPEPSARQYSQIEGDRNIYHSTPKKDVTISNGFLPNRSNQQDDELNNNNSNSYDDRSASSKEQTPLNSSYDTNDDRVTESVELKITESKEDISEQSNSSSSDRFRIRYVPLKASSDSPPEMRREIKLSNYQREVMENYNNMNGGTGTGNRRSVKDIIASINRSQSLLKFNKDPPQTSPINSTNSSSLKELSRPEPVPPPRRKADPTTTKEIDLTESLRRLSQSEQEVKRMMVELENVRDEQADNYREDDASFLQRFDAEVNNNDIFKKCILKKNLFREGSPTASNLDWNPLPKPKRTKNLSAELNNSMGSDQK